MNKTISLPLISIRGAVVFPGVSVELYLGRTFTIDAVCHTKEQHQNHVLVVSQKSIKRSQACKKSEIYSVGVECKISQSVRFPDNTMKILVEGLQAARIERVYQKSCINYADAILMDVHTQDVLNHDDRRAVLELLVRWNPSLALHEDRESIHKLFNETKALRFIASILTFTAGMPRAVHKTALKRSRSSQRSINRAVYRYQQILEKTTTAEKLKLLKCVLRDETLSELHSMRV